MSFFFGLLSKMSTGKRKLFSMGTLYQMDRKWNDIEEEMYNMRDIRGVVVRSKSSGSDFLDM